jgi:multidrug efflux pump subunit AcrA (membrane-fusion protein)
MPAPEKFRAFPGMTATVRGKALDETPGESVIIPAVALSAGEKGKSTVWVVDTEKMTVSRREVTAGSLTGENDIEVLSGLKAGETIAVSGISRLREGMRVSRLEQ